MNSFGHNRAFGDNLKKARLAKGWNQEEAAAAIGIKRSLLGAYEEGRACPTAYGLVPFAKVFHTTDLIGFLTDPDFNVSGMDSGKELAKDSLLLMRHYAVAPIRDKLAVNILLGLVDLE